MADDIKKPTKLKKTPPTQTAGVEGFVAFEAVPSQYVDWHKMAGLPAFEMFVSQQSGFATGTDANIWIAARREALGDDRFYKVYVDWHTNTGYWLNETPDGKLIHATGENK